MNVTTNRSCTPEEYIRELFSETANGIMPVTYHPIFDKPYTVKYNVDWTEKDMEALVERYDMLTASLTSIGKLHGEAEEIDPALISAEDFEVWNTFIRPYSPFDVDRSVIGELMERSEYEALEAEEQQLLERYRLWFVENSRERLAFDRCCPAKFINRAQRYEKLVSLNAPESVLAEEGRWLGVEMILYYYGSEIKN